jgi:hypothetical protein
VSGSARCRRRAHAQRWNVEDRLLLDVRDLSAFAAGAFDGVVVYGGPISYAFDQAPVALAECIRVTGRAAWWSAV